MNKNSHRVIFNAARGQRMVVAESARSGGGGASGETPAAPGSALSPLGSLGDLDICKASLLRQLALHPLTLSIALALTLGLVFYSTANAQIVADPSAPANQRPIVLQTGNGIPLVQIRTPSAAGVSRNSYSAFDIQSNGAVLNNVRSNAAQTQIGGFVQANPFLSTGAARVILNEVNSSNPSYLNGPLEVAGQRAEVIVANPSGIRVSGGTFLNASGVTLTTGTPVMNSGHLDSFLVRGGAVHIDGLGLDTRTADATTILARAVEVNAGLWAQHLKVVTGANEVSADASTVTATPGSAQGPAPQFALDVAAIGGMYAGKIHLVGTEAGLGINNGGVMSASAGDFVLEADGWLRNRGSVQASGNMATATQGDVQNEGDMYAGGSLSVTTQQALVNSGLIAARGDLTAQAHSVNSSGAFAAGLNSDGSLKSEAALLDVNASQQLTAQGTNLSSGHLQLAARALDVSNSQTRAKTLRLNATEQIDAGGADLLAQGQVNIAGKTLVTVGAQLQALGDMQITVEQLDNRAGLIQSGARLSVASDEIDNRDTRTTSTSAGAAQRGLIAQSVDLNAVTLLNQAGAVIAETDLNFASAGRIDNTQGLLSAGGALDIRESSGGTASTSSPRTLDITNTGGTFISDQQLAIAAKSLSLDGDLLSQQDMALSVQDDHTQAQGSRIVANRDLALDIEGGGLLNGGELLAGRNLSLTARSLNNTATGEISAGTTTQIQIEEALTNRGLIDGKNTQLRANALGNIGTGRIYGDTLAIQTDTLLNDTETVNGVRTDAVIAARSRLDIGVRELLNREGAAIFSAGDMAIGGALDANGRADGATSGMAEKIQNQSATIEALGALAMATQALENTNPHFTYTVSPVDGGGTAKIDYYAASGYINGDDVGWSVVEYDEPYEYRDSTKSGTKILLKTSAYADPAFRAFYLGPTPFIEGRTEWWNNGDTGGSYWVPDTYGYDRDSTIWAAFGMSPPAWGNPGQKPRPVPAADDSGQVFQPDPAAVAAWEAKIVPWVELTARYDAFKATVAAQLIPINLFRSYTETEQRAEVTSSQPARIVSGADLRLQIGQSALNENSHIVAGRNLVVTGASVTNQAAQVNAPTLRNGTLSTWTIVDIDCNEFGCEPVYDWYNAAYVESISRTVSLPSVRYEANAASGQAPLAIGALHTGATGEAAATASASNGATPGAGVAVPTGGLFKARPESTSTYLIETDPRFANYRQWLSSDYMLRALSMDPATTQKRLGDGFYEQRLVREQIAALTGSRFLGDYTNDEQQYQALMTHGATFAQAFNLRPGIALTPEQVARLTSDIVWLVSETVTLPDGSTQQVLVPRVYAMPREGDLTATGALLAGQSIQLDLSGDLTNAGTINGRQITQITAQNVHNLGGLIGGGKSTLVVAQQDINNLGGSPAARSAGTSAATPRPSPAVSGANRSISAPGRT